MSAADFPPLPDVINQVHYPGVGDADECWMMIACWGTGYSLGRSVRPAVWAFRAAAGVPDLPGPTGAGLAETYRAVARLYPEAGAIRYAGTWDLFSRRLAEGWVACLFVDSGLLPAAVRFGFLEDHAIGVGRRAGDFLVANPLAREGSRPLPCDATALRSAAEGFAGANGRTIAILFPPPEVSAVPITTTISVLPYGGRYTIPADVAVIGYLWDPVAGREAGQKAWKPIPRPSSAAYDATVQLHGVELGGSEGPFIRATNGYFAGYLVKARAVKEAANPAPAPVDPEQTAAAAKAAVNAALDKVAAALAQTQPEVDTALDRIEVAIAGARPE